MKGAAYFHPITWCIIFGTFISRTTYFMTMPFLAIYLHQAKGVSPQLIGLILGCSALLGTLSGFFGGMLSDKVGRLNVMLVSILIWCLTFVWFGLAGSVWSLAVCSALNSLCRNFFEPPSRALISDVTAPERKRAAFQLRYFMINLGGSIGPILGVYAGSSTTTTPFFITAAVYGIYGLILFYLRMKYSHADYAAHSTAAERPTFRATIRTAISDPILLCFILGGAFLTMAFSHVDTTLAQFIGNASYFPNGVQIFSYLILVNGITVMVLQYPISRITNKLSPLVSMQFGCFFHGAGIWGFGLFHSLWPLAASMAIFTVGEIFCATISDILMDQIAPRNMKGTYFGAGGLQFLGMSAGPIIGGWLLNVLGFSQGPLLFGILMLMTWVAIPFYVFGQRKFLARQKKQQVEPLPIPSSAV